MRDKGASGLRCIIPNDNQVYRLIVEKRFPPKANLAALSKIEIRSYCDNLRTARRKRTTAKLAMSLDK